MSRLADQFAFAAGLSAPTVQVIPVVLAADLFERANNPGIAGEGGEPPRFGAQRISGGAERVRDGLLALVQAERQIGFP